MTPLKTFFPSEPWVRERASDRTAGKVIDTVDNYGYLESQCWPQFGPPRLDGRATDVEIAHLQKLMRDLVTGLRNLRALKPPPYDFRERLLKQVAKIRMVEVKLFRLRQGRLL